MHIIQSDLLENGLRYSAGQPEGVCSQAMEVLSRGNEIVRVRIGGGCGGNTQGMARLSEGLTLEQAIEKLKGIDCAGRGTSCPDQLSQLFSYILVQNNQQS